MKVIITLLILALSTPTFADIFRILDSNQEAAQTRVDLVQQAQNEILTSYFIYNKDSAGLYGLALLRQAKRRGVKRIKVILDASFNELDIGMVKHLKDEGIDIRLYHPGPLPVTPGKLMTLMANMMDEDYKFGDETKKAIQKMVRRMHDKLLIVDASTEQNYLLTGGRNMKGDYYGAYHKNYDDRDVLVRSKKAVRQAQEYFYRLWDSQHVGKPYYQMAKPEQVKIAKLELDVAMMEMETNKLFKLNTCNDVTKGENEVNTVKFLHSEITQDGKVRSDTMSKQLAKIVTERTIKSLVIETPYLVPTDTFYKVIKQILDKKIYVRVLTNSLGSTDGVEVAAAYSNHKKRLIEMGIDLWEYQGPNYLHAKSAVIDDQIALIGSYNLDPRSANLNTEVAVMIDDPIKAKELRASFDKNIGGYASVQLDKNGDPIGGYKNAPKWYNKSDWMKLLRYYSFQVLSEWDVIYDQL
ncbi:MAG: phospholipase D family protein [Bacteriovoracaceae bacterium]|nr:phospholipase D family protein [Bacteriovoracaceae bacterium]